MSLFSIESLLSHSSQKLKKNFVVEKVHTQERRGVGGTEYQYLSMKNFCLTVPKDYVGENFRDVFQNFSGVKTFEDNREE